MDDKTYNGFQFTISDMCKCPEFRKQFRAKFEGVCLGMVESTYEHAEGFKEVQFRFKGAVGTELYILRASKGGVIVRETNNMLAYVVHPNGIDYQGCYL